jgi:hypothetical protein
MMPGLARAVAEPLPMPRARAFLFTGGEALAREDRFDPYELWYGSQCCGRWRDDAGNRLILGRVARRLPRSTMTSCRARASACGCATRRTRLIARARADQRMGGHLRGVPVYEPEALTLNRFALDRCWSIRAVRRARWSRLPAAAGRQCAFRSAGSQPCCTPPALRRRRCGATFEERFLAALALPSRLQKESGVEAAEVSVSRAGEKAHDQPNHPVRVEARRSVENYDDWWFAETDGFIILSDVHTEVGTSLIRELKETLPALRRAYERLVPPLTREPEVALCVVRGTRRLRALRR